MTRKSKPNKTSLLRRIIRLPARIINTRIRLSIGLAAGVLTLVLLAQLFSVIPNPNRAKMESRKLQTETLALTGSALVNTRTSLDEFQRTLELSPSRQDAAEIQELRNLLHGANMQLDAGYDVIRQALGTYEIQLPSPEDAAPLVQAEMIAVQQAIDAAPKCSRPSCDWP